MSTVFLCRASGEGSHNFKVCAALEDVVTFYGSMFGEDTTGDLMGYLCDEDRWSMGVAYHEGPLLREVRLLEGRAERVVGAAGRECRGRGPAPRPEVVANAGLPR